MKPQASKVHRVLILTPVLGTVIFAVLYFVATLLYPGGSQVDKDAVGFSWKDNYWCNLLNENAINGQPNPAKPIAVAGMFVLCLTLIFFWFLFPKQINLHPKLKKVIQLSGTAAMTIALFLFTSLNHDIVTNLASFFGIIAAAGTFIGLYQVKWFGLFLFGILNMVLVGLNNYVYYTEGLIIYLPVIQKITFASFLTWLCCVNIKLYRSRKESKVPESVLP